MRKRYAAIAYLLILCLILSGCGDKLLERSYSTVTPHSAAYRETEDADTLRAENYQDLVNALLILLGEHSEDGVVRVYGDAPDKARMVENACVEVQKETAVGAYLLDYITYDGKDENGYYELTVRFGYRRTAEEQAAIVNATSTEALPDLLRTAVEEGRSAVAVRFGWFGTDRAGVMAMLSSVYDEFHPSEETEPPAEKEIETEAAERSDEPQAMPPIDGEPAIRAAELPPEPAEPEYDLSPWEVLFYPNDVRPGIIEVLLHPEKSPA